jgi:hypothetical protein
MKNTKTMEMSGYSVSLQHDREPMQSMVTLSISWDPGNPRSAELYFMSSAEAKKLAGLLLELCEDDA